MRKEYWQKWVAASLVTAASLLIGGEVAWAQTATTSAVSISSEPEQALPTSNEPGVLIVAVEPEGPAAEAGIRRGDILLTVNGSEVNDAPTLQNVLQASVIGDTIEVTFTHGDDEKSVEIELGERAGRPFLGVQPFGSLVAHTVAIQRASPFADTDITTWHSTVNTTAGIQIIEVIADSPAAEAGLESGTLLTEIAGEALTPEVDITTLLDAYAPSDEITLTVQPLTSEAVSETITVTLGAQPDDESAAYLGVRLAPFVTIQRLGTAPNALTGAFASASPLAAPGRHRFATPVSPSALPLPVNPPMMYGYAHPGYMVPYVMPMVPLMVPPWFWASAPPAAPLPNLQSFGFTPGADAAEAVEIRSFPMTTPAVPLPNGAFEHSLEVRPAQPAPVELETDVML